MDSKKELKKMFPHLFKEIEAGANKVEIGSICADPEEAEARAAEIAKSNVANDADSSHDDFRNYNPTVIDFLRRCDTADQAEEIIDYMYNKGELTKDHACQLRIQLKNDGVRSFGPKKETDYYLKNGRL